MKYNIVIMAKEMVGTVQLIIENVLNNLIYSTNISDKHSRSILLVRVILYMVSIILEIPQ